MTEPEPDTKDWTWTLTRTCPECHESVADLTVAEVADRAEAAAVEWVQILTSSPALGVRPAPQVWSPLEYGAHVRDVFVLFDERLAMMLAEDEPTFPNWDQDETALTSAYAAADADEVADELDGAADAFVARLRSLTPADHDRRGRRSDGSEFTVVTLSRYFLHDVLHHLWDVTGQETVPVLR